MSPSRAPGACARPVIALLIFAETSAAPALPKPPLHDPVAEVVRPCPKSKAGEITVCGRNGTESPYRLPPQFRGDQGFEIEGAIDSVSRERHKLMDVGGAGAQQNACSATGAAGWTGCEVKDWKQLYEQRGFRPPQ